MRKLGLFMTVLAAVSFFVLCVLALRFVSLGYSLTTYFTSQGNVVPSYLPDIVFALNGLCGLSLIVEGMFLLLGNRRMARAILPCSFALVIAPYLVPAFYQDEGIEFMIANIVFYPIMLIGLILLSLSARALSGMRDGSDPEIQ